MMPQLNIIYLFLFVIFISGSANVDVQGGDHVLPKTNVLKVDEPPESKQGDIPTLKLDKAEPEVAKVRPQETEMAKVRPQEPEVARVRPQKNLIFPGNNEKHNGTTVANDGVIHETYQTPMIESGAIKRGILVFVGLSMLFIGYVGFKTYRNRGKQPNIVKYGVRARRTDMEMRPFSLEEDEEDETLFDLKHVNSRN